ncbi:hypothetical protein L9F63_002861, partial [Diploptera punctata]
ECVLNGCEKTSLPHLQPYTGQVDKLRHCYSVASARACESSTIKGKINIQNPKYQIYVFICQLNVDNLSVKLNLFSLHIPPDILYDETSADLSVQEGENATLVCKATGHPPPRITWRREDGEPILLRRGPRDI